MIPPAGVPYQDTIMGTKGATMKCTCDCFDL